MAKLCPLMVSTTTVEPQPCKKEQCAWWVETEEDGDGGICSVLVLALNSICEVHSHEET